MSETALFNPLRVINKHTYNFSSTDDIILLSNNLKGLRLVMNKEHCKECKKVELTMNTFKTKETTTWNKEIELCYGMRSFSFQKIILKSKMNFAFKIEYLSKV